MLLNNLDIDWNLTDTRILNGIITKENVKKYNEILDERLLHILDDLIYEGLNEIYTQELQKEIEDIVIKRLFR